MSKKIASGANKLVLEVTCGKGAFMKTKEEAEKLSLMMKQLGELSKIETICVLTNMNQPIGRSIRKLFRNRRSKKCFDGRHGRRC